MDKQRRSAFVAGMNSSILALLDGLGGPELFVIGLVVLLLFGSKRMPEIGRGIGRAIREFKRATSSVEENIREVFYEEPARPRLRPPVQQRAFRDASPPPSVAQDPMQAAPARPVEFNEPAPRERPAADTDVADSDARPRPGDPS